MKTCLGGFSRHWLAAILVSCMSQFLGLAQTVTIPRVAIYATDAVALESGKPATFTVERSGSLVPTLNVYYQIGGTASNGVDYQMISHFVTVPSGASSATITINPLVDTNNPGTKTVVLTLAPSPLLNPVNFIISSPSNAVVYIFDDTSGSNLPPAVRIISPADGARYQGPANILLLAKAFDPDGSISGVEYFANGQNIGAGLPVVLDPPGVNGVTGLVYLFNWENVSNGDYAVTAVATDNDGATTTSDPIHISVLPPPPTVKITSPTNGSVFVAPVHIPISAEATASSEDVVRVDFFADDHFIGTDAGTNKAGYNMVWSNALPGFYSLRAVAIDSLGGEGSSAPVFVAIIGSTPPPPRPVVTIFARDPIAVVGTNCLGCYSNAAAAKLNYRSVTNTATFVVRREGETNDSLTVYYSTGGTASNGVDYAMLPGAVTIDPGRRTALIVIDPFAENVPECPETVVLTLQQPTNTPPPYIAGWPDKATALIVDCNFVPPATSQLCAGPFHVCLPLAVSPPFYHLECSLDMVHWLPVGTNTASVLGIHFTDADSCASPNRFYRVVPDAAAPPDFP